MTSWPRIDRARCHNSLDVSSGRIRNFKSLNHLKMPVLFGQAEDGLETYSELYIGHLRLLFCQFDIIFDVALSLYSAFTNPIALEVLNAVQNTYRYS